MATDDEEAADVPPQFQSFADRHDLEYRQTPPGIALYLGLGAVFLGLLFSTAPKVSPDRTIGYVLLGCGALLLITSRVLHQRMRTRDDELYRQYLRWKKERREPPVAGE